MYKHTLYLYYIDYSLSSNTKFIFMSRYVVSHHLEKYAPYLLVFLVSFAIRAIAWKLFGPLFNSKCGDSIEYYITSINLQPHSFFKVLWGYEYWYERTPGYVLFLHFIERNLLIQVIISSLGCVFMYKINKYAGLLWIFYPQDIFHSFQYNKECLLVFLIIVSIFFLKHKKYILITTILLIIISFSSFGEIVKRNHILHTGFMNAIWELWKPAFNTSVGYSSIFVYTQFLPYSVILLYFFRHCKIFSSEFLLFVIISLTYSTIYAEPRYREPFMPVLFLFCSPAIEKKICGVRKLIENVNILFKLHYVEKKLILELERRIKDDKLMLE